MNDLVQALSEDDYDNEICNQCGEHKVGGKFGWKQGEDGWECLSCGQHPNSRKSQYVQAPLNQAKTEGMEHPVRQLVEKIIGVIYVDDGQTDLREELPKVGESLTVKPGEYPTCGGPIMIGPGTIGVIAGVDLGSQYPFTVQVVGHPMKPILQLRHEQFQWLPGL